jgi:hypothetical protein
MLPIRNPYAVRNPQQVEEKHRLCVCFCGFNIGIVSALFSTFFGKLLGMKRRYLAAGLSAAGSVGHIQYQTDRLAIFAALTAVKKLSSIFRISCSRTISLRHLPLHLA